MRPGPAACGCSVPYLMRDSELVQVYGFIVVGTKNCNEAFSLAAQSEVSAVSVFHEIENMRSRGSACMGGLPIDTVVLREPME